MVPQNPQPVTIESIASSIQNLNKRWNRRQKWKLFFNPTDQEQDNKAAWRTSLTKFLESTPLHAITILLLLLDLVLTILEISSSLLSCSKNHKTQQVWYHWLGIAILSLLCAKAMGLAIGLGRSFFRRPGYVVDGAVVIGASILESFVEEKEGSLLVVVSLWRVVRVVESAFELSDEAIEAQIEGIVSQFQVLRQENTKLLATIAEKEIIIDKLQEMIEMLQSNSYQRQPCVTN